MPFRNQFRHNRYAATRPSTNYRLMVPPPQPPVDSPQFARRMADVGRALRGAGVDAIVLVHGTFVGDDYFDLAPLLECWSPALADRFRAANRRMTDYWLGDAGYFCEAYAARLRTLINPPGERPIEVRRFSWSGGNTHVARAIAAVRLIDDLSEAAPPALLRGGDADSSNGHAVPRVLCLGHSHGSNVLALMTNLLVADPESRRHFATFVQQAVPKARRPGAWLSLWQRAVERLNTEGGENLINGSQLDLVTFGMPIRYGWDAGGYGQLLHFVNQRPAGRLSPWRGRWPQTLEDAVVGRDGDFVALIGIAGTNFAPLPVRWRRWRAERAIGALVQEGVSSREIRNWVRFGQRVPDEGSTLLVDYGEAPRRGRLRHIFGHGMYTNAAWMPFQLEQIVEEFYAASNAPHGESVAICSEAR